MFVGGFRKLRYNGDVMVRLSRQQLEEFHKLEHHHLLRIILFVVFFAGASGGVLWLQMINWEAGYVFLLSLPFYILAAASLHGISLFTHEGVHDILLENPIGNRLLSAVCAWPVLQNYSAYRVLHLRHHNSLAEQNDPDHYHNYSSSSVVIFLLHWGRLLFGYPVYISAIPLLGLWHATLQERLWILWEAAMVLLFIYGLYTAIPFEIVLHVWLIPMSIIHFMVNIRGMSQHTLLENAQDQIQGTRSILTNRVTTFFMCNENYHLEHHLYPKVPWYNLPKVHSNLAEELRQQGAPYIQSYAHFVWDFVMATVRRNNVRTVSLDALQESK